MLQFPHFPPKIPHYPFFRRHHQFYSVSEAQLQQFSSSPVFSSFTPIYSRSHHTHSSSNFSCRLLFEKFPTAQQQQNNIQVEHHHQHQLRQQQQQEAEEQQEEFKKKEEGRNDGVLFDFQRISRPLLPKFIHQRIFTNFRQRLPETTRQAAGSKLASSMKKVIALLLFLVILIGVLLHFADFLDVYCEKDADCKQPTMCRLVCRKNCRSLCVLMMDMIEEKEEGHVVQNDAVVPSSDATAADGVNDNWWSSNNNNMRNKRPMVPLSNLDTLNAQQQALLRRRQLHRKPSVLRSEEEPFDTEANLFAAAAVPIKQPETALSPPTKANNLPSNLAPLTISEAELEAELRQLTGPDNAAGDDGPIGFVTAPGSEPVTTMRTHSEANTDLREIFATAATRIGGNDGRNFIHHQHHLQQDTSASGDFIMPKLLSLSTSMESRDEPQMPPQKPMVFTTTTVSPPSFSPQPPGFTPTTTIATTPFTTMTRTANGLPTTSTLQPLSIYTSTMRTKIIGYASEEEFERRKSGIFGNKTQQFYQMTTGTRSPWFHKMRPSDLVSVNGIGGSPSMPMPFSFRRTTQLVPTHKTNTGETATAITTMHVDANANAMITTTTTMRTTLRKCGAPPVCRRNCGVVIDWDGCQSCQCLWTSKTCHSDKDCRSLEGQICDLGRCECGPGYEHNPQHSGICRQISSNWNKNIAPREMPMQRDSIQLSTYPSPTPIDFNRNIPSSSSSQFISSILISGRSHHQVPNDRLFHTKSMIQQQAYHLRRLKKRMAETSALVEKKPPREERLQWPGPCDSDEHCPAQLYCVHGDCWSLDTERALRHKQRDATGTQLEHDTVGRGKSPHASAMVKAVFPQHLPTMMSYQKRLAPLINNKHIEQEPLKQAQQTNNANNSSSVLFPTLQILEQNRHPISNDSNQRQSFKEQLSPITQSFASTNEFKTTSSVSTTTTFSIPIAQIPFLSNDEHYEQENGDDNANADGQNYSMKEGELVAHENSKEESSFEDEYEGNNSANDWLDQGQEKQVELTPIVTTPMTASTLLLTTQNTNTFLPLSYQKLEDEQNLVQLSLTNSSHTLLKPDTMDKKLPSTVSIDGNTQPPSIKPSTNYFASLNTTNIVEYTTLQQPTVPISNTDLEGQRSTELNDVSQHNMIPMSFSKPVEKHRHERRIFLNYSRSNRIRRPVRVEMVNSKEFMKDECHESRACGRRLVCCLKRWCDLGGECGLAKFCLPNCELTKLTHLSELINDEDEKSQPRMDLIYD